MKAKRKMSEDEKDRRNMARIERKMLAAQMAVRCSACGEAGKILWSGDQPPVNSAPPLWLVEHSWLLEDHPLCVQCIETDKRAELCFEGGDIHDFWELAGRVACIDCGWDGEERENETPTMDQVAGFLECARLKSAIAARAAEIEELADWIDADVLSGPERDATAQRIKHLGADLRWRARRLAEKKDILMYLDRPKDRVLH
jgi:hypothetical protein